MINSVNPDQTAYFMSLGALWYWSMFELRYFYLIVKGSIVLKKKKKIDILSSKYIVLIPS